MSLEQRLTTLLNEFEERTDGVLGSCIVSTSDALMMAEASHSYDREAIQAMSEKFIALAKDTLDMLIPSPDLESITVEERYHFLYVRRINPDYHIVALTDRSETMGLRELNVRELIKRLQNVFG